MNITILGATGKTGRLAVEQALARGFQVKIYARNPQGFTSSAQCQITQGELADTNKLAQSLAGSDAVLCCLGTHQLRHVQLMQTQLPHTSTQCNKAACNG